MDVVTGLANPYWDAVKRWAVINPVGQMVLGWRYAACGLDLPQAAEVPDNMFIDAMQMREDLVRRYAWTITAPDTVSFVDKHVGPLALDPLAGTGYWAYLLAQRGVDVVAFDLKPSQDTYHPVAEADAVTAVREHYAGRTLLLAWPPYGDPVGAEVLGAYVGYRVVYFGELGGNCGDDRMNELLHTKWRKVAEHVPAQWAGMHDVVAVFKR